MKGLSLLPLLYDSQVAVTAWHRGVVKFFRDLPCLSHHRVVAGKLSKAEGFGARAAFADEARPHGVVQLGIVVVAVIAHGMSFSVESCPVLNSSTDVFACHSFLRRLRKNPSKGFRAINAKVFESVRKTGRVQEWGGASSPRLASRTAFYEDEPSRICLACCRQHLRRHLHAPLNRYAVPAPAHRLS